MADFPPNLDDGELWLPSDILPNEKSVRSGSSIKQEDELFPSELTYMEELAQQLSSYALLEQQHQTQTQTTKKSPTPNPEVIPFGSFEPNQKSKVVGGGGNRNRGTGVVHSVYASDQGGYRVELTPGYHIPPIRPSIPQGNKGFVHTRGRILQNQQNQGHVGNYFLPFVANGGGFVKGTGVFLPRIQTTITKKQGVKNDENCYTAPVKRNSNKNSVGKKEVVGLKAATEMGLPPEWTY